MKDGNFYTMKYDENFTKHIYECNNVDTNRITIEYNYKISEEDIEEGSLVYYKNGNIYCCSWFGTAKTNYINDCPFQIKNKVN